MSMISQLNPVARFVGVAGLTLPLLLSVDWVSAAVALILCFILAAALGYDFRKLPRHGWPIWIAMPVTGLSMALYGSVGGDIYWQWGFITISENSLELSLAAMLRVAAIGIPAIIFLSQIDPTHLGNSLTQIMKLPDRFVLAAVASARLLTLSQRDVVQLRQARRARGIATHGGIRRAMSITFGLFVLALRRGAKLATAMEARGFGHSATRTYVHPVRLTRADHICMLAGLVCALVAIAVAIAVGEYRFLGQ
ncbi:MAG: energy-coupling factor transporter transmembrane component T [Corynebacterium sp.]|nr:energy-coupling factor transporter transmembrane component T [Corynebacterium sp.]